MKSFVTLLTCLLFLLSCQPSPETIGNGVQKQLQEKIDATFPGSNGQVKVTGVVAIQEAGNKYQAIANIVAYGSPLSLKLAVVADTANFIFEVAKADWGSFVSSVNQNKFKVVDGKLSDVAATNEIVFSSFPAVLSKDKQKFAERLATVVPVKQDGIYWFGTGCKAHECGNEDAAWALNRENGNGYAIIVSTGVAGPTFSIYGHAPEDLPPPTAHLGSRKWNDPVQFRNHS